MPVPFLLQQAAWLYEHQLSTVRAQMQRISTSRPTSMVGAPELSVISHTQGKLSVCETSNSGSGSGSGNASTVKGSQAGSGRGSFRASAATLAQTRSTLSAARPSQGMHAQSTVLKMILILLRSTRGLSKNEHIANSYQTGHDG